MKRSAILLASTAMLLAGPAGAGTNAPLHHPQPNAGSHVLLAQQEGELPADDPQAEELFRQQEKEAEAAKRAARQEAEQQLKEQRAAEQDAKREADRAAQEAAETQKQVEEKARRQADHEAAKQVEEAEKRAQDEKAKRITEEEQRKTESQLEKRAERAKKETDAEIRQTERTQEKAAERAKRQTRAAQREAEEEAQKAAEQAKRQADKALRQEQEEQSAPTPDPERAPAQEAPEEALPEQPTGEQPLNRRQAVPDEPAAPEEATPMDEQATPPPPSDQAEQPADDGTRAEQPSAAPPATGETAPALDSAKEAAPAAPEGSELPRRLQRQSEGTEEAAPSDQAEQPAPAPPPANDAEAQRLENPIRVESVRAEEGRRVERAPRWERPRDVQVLQQSDDRTLVEINNNIYVESPDRPRLSRDAREVYYEDLPRQRVRETIVRPNGVQIVTIRNRYGDVIQRSRIMPDGSEILLSYTPDDAREERIAWRDPGEDLPPLRLAIPEDEYIFDDPDAPEDEVYAFLSQPPVERVERTYSIDEVKRSARLRDKLRRIDLDTITFGFGSADIAEDQIARMENVANAMLEILKKNPAETFLIEGHTDAVGSDRANLVLSDRRAEAVAEALTNVFEIPPENMSTQGYGERYLKISTQAPEQENRRVAIRRITPLVAPVASR